MRTFFRTAIRGLWSFGWELYPNKPMCGFYADRYDGAPIYSLHLGPLWIELDSVQR